MKQQSYINSQPRWTLVAGREAFVKAYLAHHKGHKTDLTQDRFPLNTIHGNLSLFVSRYVASRLLGHLIYILTARGTHRVVYIGKVRYLEPVGLDKPFIQPGLHSFSQAPGFFQPSVAQA